MQSFKFFSQCIRCIFIYFIYIVCLLFHLYQEEILGKFRRKNFSFMYQKLYLCSFYAFNYIFIFPTLVLQSVVEANLLLYEKVQNPYEIVIIESNLFLLYLKCYSVLYIFKAL